MTCRIPPFTVYPKKYAHGFCFAVLCCGYTLTDFPISIRLTSLALWQYNDCPSASKATLMNMDKYFMWIHYERLHNHNKAKYNKTVCIFLGIYCIPVVSQVTYAITLMLSYQKYKFFISIISLPYHRVIITKCKKDVIITHFNGLCWFFLASFYSVFVWRRDSHTKLSFCHILRTHMLI